MVKMLSKCKKIVYSLLILFGVRYKRIFTLTTFTDSLKDIFQLLNHFFLQNFAYFLAYWIIALNMQKCGELQVQTQILWFPWRQKL